MQTTWAAIVLLFCLFLGSAGVAQENAVVRKPSDLPVRYRDFKVYATSAPDPANADRIVLTVQFRNEGQKVLKGRASLEPLATAGFKGAEDTLNLVPGGVIEWKLELRPPDGFRYDVLKGGIDFGKTRARDLYIALQGPDGDAVSNRLQKIIAKAEAVGTFAPTTAMAWWRSDPSVSQAPVGRRRTLAAAGKTNYRIVVGPMPRNADGSEMTAEAWAKIERPRPGEAHLIQAVNDLQRCLQQMSGAKLAITSDNKAPSPAIRLVITPNRPAPRTGANRGSEAGWRYGDSYDIHTEGNGDVVISSGHLDGLRQGVYGLLTDHLDCHWFLPQKLGEEIPQPADRTVVIGEIHDRRDPSFFSVTGMQWGPYRDWDLRNRSFINRGRMSFGHSWEGYLPSSEESFKEHPDWWARDREGKVRRRGTTTNFCSTSPEVIEKVAQKVNAALSDPDAIVTSLDPNDYAPMCLCDRCLALDKSYGVTQEDGTYVTDRLLHFSREIYDRLEPKNKEKYLGILVYAYQMELPKKAVPHAHHAGMVCNMDWDYDHTRPFNDPTSPQNRNFHRLIAGWGKILPQFGFYDYYGHYSNYGPWGVVSKMREDLPAFRDLGGTYLMIEAQPNFALHGLNLYIASRLAWDVDADVDALLEEFFFKFYGPAASPMRQYWMSIERHFALTRPGGGAINRVNANPALYTELEGYLKAAELAATSAPQRFRDRITFARDGLELGRRQNEVSRKYGGRRGMVPATNFDPAQAHADVEANRAWYAAIRKKYPDNDEYYPHILRPIFYDRLEAALVRVERRAKGEAEPAPR